IGPHELLEQRNLRLPSQIRVLEGVEVAQEAAPLGLERLSQLGERHLLPLRRDRRMARLDVDHRQAPDREALQHGPRLLPLIPQEMAEDLPGGPLSRRVRLVQVRLHPLELLPEIRRRVVALLLQLVDCRTGHWSAPWLIRSWSFGLSRATCTRRARRPWTPCRSSRSSCSTPPVR